MSWFMHNQIARGIRRGNLPNCEEEVTEEPSTKEKLPKLDGFVMYMALLALIAITLITIMVYSLINYSPSNRTAQQLAYIRENKCTMSKIEFTQETWKCGDVLVVIPIKN